ncbi:winged helix-turn-helix transcriptional regulator [Qipengyuania spongiae]|uniref:Helix-turn-helix transcriptional regulator n=1 Tax=Qipengyuania spongiae TaxID=2909673 RepID=A0ABY5SYE1_9SPHN|nr:helix-turn-helix domain-containing protein [Qipengyuania spongiae]UVI39557.1 helix-turn-helix transcriptional regulator [Qipengyuania spongiae]
MELIGERWSLLVVRELMFGPRRFSDLRASLPGISAKVLTERLAGLENAGVLTRRKLPPPISAHAYELTLWGYAAEPLIQELGRWAAMSSQHDPTLQLSPVSFMLSLRTMLDKEAAKGWNVRIGFRFPEVGFVAEVKDGEMPVRREEPEDCDATFVAPSGPSLAAMFYVGMAAAEVGVTVQGAHEAAERFVALFSLPEKIG